MERGGRPRDDAIAEIARLLPQRNGQLGRLLWRHARGPLHRGMASVLATLDDGPQPVSRLAEHEGVAQPTLTRMVARLEAEGFVHRERSADDGRVVLVGLTPRGVTELAGLRQRYLAVLHERLGGLGDEQLRALCEASEAIQVLVDALRADPTGVPPPGQRTRPDASIHAAPT
jgi:DNA-binding MarR family transcriptional regulator